MNTKKMKEGKIMVERLFRVVGVETLFLTLN